MPETRYREILRGPGPWDALPWTLQTPDLEPHLDFFVASHNRIATLAHTPAYLCYFSGRDRRMEANALAGVSNINRVAVQDMGKQNFTNAVVADIQKQIADLNALPSNILSNLILQQSVPYVENTMLHSKEIGESIAAIYSAMIFEAWICFESMASDLWVTAIDKGPPFLANTAANSKELKTPDKQITPAILHSLKYDARRELGLFLRETRRVSFQKLSDIRSTYKIVFDKPAWDLFANVNGGYIKALSAFRNVFAHRAGKADADFVDQVKRFPDFNTIKENDQIVLDAAMARQLWHASAHMGLALIKFVDDYIHEQSN